MMIFTNSPKLWLASLGVSLAIFLGVYILVIKPAQNTANQAVHAGLQQGQQALSQAQQQLKQAQSQGGSVSSQASSALSTAQKLTACVSAAGTDTTKLAACESNYGG